MIGRQGREGAGRPPQHPRAGALGRVEAGDREAVVALVPGRPQADTQVPRPRGAGASAADLELVAGVLAGSVDHFERLYQSYFPRVYRFALKRLGDPAEAEDVTQEVFETILHALPSFRGNSSLLVWAFGITRNKVNRRFRGHRPRLEPLDDAGVDGLAGPDAPADRAVDARRMLDRCEQIISEDLTPLQRRIFHLKHLRRQPIRAIAQALDKSEDAVKANLYRMRRTLAEGAPGLETLLEL